MKQLDWCSVPVTVDNDTTELFEMPEPDEDAEQQLEFRVTKSTEIWWSRIRPIRAQLATDGRQWREAKERVMQDKRAQGTTAVA